MLGTNELCLNHATIIEAVQEYLTRRMPTTPLTVTSVKPSKRSSYGHDNDFDVTVTTADAARPEPAHE